jgi:NAD(P)-dependent dehydrogenase (short-subunit alcohol dehydrogenase family)
MKIRLDGKVALITGAGHGMGRAGALAFADAGASVVVADIRQEAAEDTAGEVRARGGQALAVAADVTSDQSAAWLVQSTIGEFGGLDIVWNCVGGVFWKPDGTRPATDVLAPQGDILSIDPDYWDWQLRLNLTSVFLTSRHAIPRMIERGGGVILAMATGGAMDVHESGVGHHPYAVAKSGVITLSRLIAREYGRQGIRSNVLIPGTVNSWPSPEIEAHATRRTAAARIGTVEEVAGAALFLASDAAAYITGEELRLDGGSHVYGRIGYAG